MTNLISRKQNHKGKRSQVKIFAIGYVASGSLSVAGHRPWLPLFVDTIFISNSSVLEAEIEKQNQ